MVGDPCDPTFLERVFQGKDVVVSTLGGKAPTKASTSVFYRSAEAIVEAAQVTGLKRVLVTSTALLFPPRSLWDRLLIMMVPHTVRSAQQMEDVLKGSELSWTIARCGFLNNNEICEYRAEVDSLPKKGSFIARAGLASFLLDTMEQFDAVRRVFGVSRPA